MPTYDSQLDDEFDPNDPLPADLSDDDDDAALIECPACGAEVYEEAEQCPHCGEWIIHSAAARGRHWIWIAGAILALAAMIVLSIT